MIHAKMYYVQYSVEKSIPARSKLFGSVQEAKDEVTRIMDLIENRRSFWRNRPIKTAEISIYRHTAFGSRCTEYWRMLQHCDWVYGEF